jgi:hypothetical protein
VFGEFFGQLIGTGERSGLLIGYLIAAGLMIIAALVELALGVRPSGDLWRASLHHSRR